MTQIERRRHGQQVVEVVEVDQGRAGAPTAFHYDQRGELGTFYRVEASAGYALVGTLPKERLVALARSIYKQPPPLAASAPR